MIRERKLSTLQYVAGGVSQVELPKDAVYHQFQLSLSGQASIAYGVGPSASTFIPGFPFNLIKQIRLVRNGSDVVWQGSGKMLAAENLILNRQHPRSRIYADSNGAILSATVNGVTVPANSEGIGERAAQFQDTPVASTTVVTDFDAQLEMYLQLGCVDDKWWSTLLDARPLSSFVMEITWENSANVIVAGTTGVVSILNTQIALSSYDQDNVSMNQNFGTFKRSQQSLTSMQYQGTGQQFLLPRGNFYAGMILETLSQKNAGAIQNVAIPEQAVIAAITNRINTNYFLRQSDFKVLQGKNKADLGTSSPFQCSSGSPRGLAYLGYTTVGDRVSELIPTFTFDTFDLLLDLGNGTENGPVAAGAIPTINVFLQEVIPGRSIAPNAPQGAFAGSNRRTSAQPYR